MDASKTKKLFANLRSLRWYVRLTRAAELKDSSGIKRDRIYFNNFKSHHSRHRFLTVCQEIGTILSQMDQNNSLRFLVYALVTEIWGVCVYDGGRHPDSEWASMESDYQFDRPGLDPQHIIELDKILDGKTKDFAKRVMMFKLVNL